MKVLRIVAGLFATAFVMTAQPAAAQFYFKSKDLAGPPVTGAEPGIIGQELPGATPEELRAAMVWNLRAALNVAALQCQFEPTLLTLRTYNGFIKDHDAEIDDALKTLEKYFRRNAKTVREGRAANDQFDTRVYSSYSTVSAQRIFCQTAASIGEDAVHAPKGGLASLAATRLRELRNSLTSWGEQQFPFGGYGYVLGNYQPRLPDFTNERCWRKDIWQDRRCGAAFPAATATAAS